MLKLESIKNNRKELLEINNQKLYINHELVLESLLVCQIEKKIIRAIEESLLIPMITNQGKWKLSYDDILIEGSCTGLFYQEENITNQINELLKMDLLLFG